ncbi:MAG: DUF2029 domain-containing protein [Chloroflexi bacterium]|nr:DUF2029 domain-containing protein [Chloroflexota bacterium]
MARLLCPLFILLLLWLWLFKAEGAFAGGPNGKSFEADFAMFLTAAQIMKDGGNPYDHDLLYTTERRLLQRQGLPITRQRAIVRVGNPPLLFWALEPLTGFPFQRVALAWLACMYLLSFTGFLACLRYLGWKRWLVPSLIFLLMPQVVFGPYYGNIVCLVFAGLGCALALLHRRPFLAGMLLSLTLIKPQVALPIVGLLVLFHPARRRSLLAGFGAATTGLLALTVLATGWHRMLFWLHALVGYSNDLRQSPDVASLAGLYVRLTGGAGRSALQLLCLVAAVALTAHIWRTRRGDGQMPILSVSVLWLAWFLATPYAHFFDEVLLTVPLLALVGRDANRLTWRPPAVALYLMFFSLTVISATPFNVQLLPLPLVGILICLIVAERNPAYRPSPPLRGSPAPGRPGPAVGSGSHA